MADYKPTKIVIPNSSVDFTWDSPALKEKKVFNLGFSKTGTTSLELALQMLGYRVALGHWKLNYCFYLFSVAIHHDFDEIIRFTRCFDAFCDAPWGGHPTLFRRLTEEYPKAHYILTLRHPVKWYKSLRNMLTLFDENEETALSSYHKNGMWGSAYWFRNIFGIHEIHQNRRHIVDIYEKYNKDVKEYFAKQNIPLLVLDVTEENDPWKPLCQFLHLDIPKRSFPKANPSPTNRENRKNDLRKRVAEAIGLNHPLF